MDAPRRRTLIVAEAAATVGTGLSAATRVVATELFHAFGSPEVRQIDGDGALRVEYLGGDVRQWAERHGIAMTDEVVTGE